MRVASAEALQAALDNAQRGDVIMVGSGTYRGDFTLSTSGTAARPITIRAETPGQAVFKGSVVTLRGQHGIVMGLVFANGQVTLPGDFNRVTRNVFKNGRPGGNNSKLSSAVGVSGSHNRIDHNEIAHWQRRGLRVLPHANTKNNRFDHNYLHDFFRTGQTNSGDALQNRQQLQPYGPVYRYRHRV